MGTADAVVSGVLLSGIGAVGSSPSWLRVAAPSPRRRRPGPAGPLWVRLCRCLRRAGAPAPVGRRALFLVVGWLGLVGPAVAAMAIATSVNHDPNTSAARVIAMTVLGLAFAARRRRLPTAVLSTDGRLVRPGTEQHLGSRAPEDPRADQRTDGDRASKPADHGTLGGPGIRFGRAMSRRPAPFAILNRVGNPVVRVLLRSPLHAALSGQLALITLNGR